MADKEHLGTFYGVGVGPGDPELLTMKAVRVIREADWVVVPTSQSKKDSLALEIAREHVNGSKVLEKVFPMTRDEETLNRFWSEAADDILERLSGGDSVAFLTIGDPLTFSTYQYVLRILSESQPDLRIVTIPGITSYNSAASAANFSLVEQRERMAVIPVSDDVSELRPVLETFDTVVLMKVAKKLDEVVDLLDEMNLLDRAVFASNVSRPEEIVSTDLRSVKGTGKGYMSVIIVKRGGVQGARNDK